MTVIGSAEGWVPGDIISQALEAFPSSRSSVLSLIRNKVLSAFLSSTKKTQDREVSSDVFRTRTGVPSSKHRTLYFRAVFFFFPSQDESVFIFVGFLLKSSSLVKLSAFSEKLQGFDIQNFG